MARQTKCLTIDRNVLAAAQAKADEQNISLSRFMENLLMKELNVKKEPKQKK